MKKNEESLSEQWKNVLETSISLLRESQKEKRKRKNQISNLKN